MEHDVAGNGIVYFKSDGGVDFKIYIGKFPQIVGVNIKAVHHAYIVHQFCSIQAG